MAQNDCKWLRKAPSGSKYGSKGLQIAQYCSKLLQIAQNFSKLRPNIFKWLEIA
jgi:hypothetical protein